MRKLFDFLVRKRHWLLFILLEIVSFTFLYRNSDYQRSILVSSANAVTGRIASVSGSITSYLNLKDINRDLLERNGQLEMQVLALQGQLGKQLADSATFVGYLPDSTEVFPFTFMTAKVVYNSVNYLSNYITIDKGKNDGVEPDMGVVSEKGVVGVVSTVNDHFSVVIPLLNPKLGLSAKVKGSNYFGPLHWNGRSARYVNLDDLARHVEFQKGDTIVTSGFSSMFPAGIVVGTVHEFERQRDDNFYSLEIELATDFQALNYVRVIRNAGQGEQRKVEEEARRHDK